MLTGTVAHVGPHVITIRTPQGSYSVPTMEARPL
jgi:hypothetical protein